MNGKDLLTTALSNIFPIGQTVKLALGKEKDTNFIKNLIKTSLLGEPVDIYDEYENYYMESVKWELKDERLDGLYQGSRKIGSANIMYCTYLILELYGVDIEEGYSILEEILESLKEEGTIRMVPEFTRSTFKLVEEEANSDTRTN